MLFHQSRIPEDAGWNEGLRRTKRAHFRMKLRSTLIINCVFCLILFGYHQYKRFRDMIAREIFLISEYKRYETGRMASLKLYAYQLREAEAECPIGFGYDDPAKKRRLALTTVHGAVALFELRDTLYYEKLANHYKNRLRILRDGKFRFWQALEPEPPKPSPPKKEDVLTYCLKDAR